MLLPPMFVPPSRNGGSPGGCPKIPWKRFGKADIWNASPESALPRIPTIFLRMPSGRLGTRPNHNAHMTSKIIIRAAVMAELQALEAVQLRASLTNAGDREALLANPDAIRIPLEQLAAARVFVAELNGETPGFSAIEPRVDGQIELDALFVEPKIRRHGVGRLMVEYCAQVARKQG